MEVQSHGNQFEDLIIKDRTGVSKSDYEQLLANGYTAAFDLTEGVLVDYNGSIKTTKNNTVCCSDVIRMMSHNDYHLIVGQYDQKGGNKVFHTVYEFVITPQDYNKLWGDMDIEKVGEFVDYVKSIPHGKQAQQDTKSERQNKQQKVTDKKALFTLNPKVDSKKQRRVQCSVKLSDLVKSGIKYTQNTIEYTIESGVRKFNK